MPVLVFQGTENVMSAVIKSKASVKRVVLTSSIAAMRSTGTPAPPVNPPLYGEHDWNEVRGCLRAPVARGRALVCDRAHDLGGLTEATHEWSACHRLGSAAGVTSCVCMHSLRSPHECCGRVLGLNGLTLSS